MNERNAAALLVEAFILALRITQRLEQLHKQGHLHKGHRMLEIGRKAWVRYERRRVGIEMVKHDMHTRDERVDHAARLHAEATALVETLTRRWIGAASVGNQEDADDLYRLIERATRRRARRLHKFINLTRRP